MKKFIFIGLFLLFAIKAEAATQLLKTVMPSGGDYTSLEACMNANEQNLVTADKYFDVKIDGTWSAADTTACVIELYTTDATHYINIYTTTTARHLGVWSTSYYRLYVTNQATMPLSLNVNFTTINGLQIKRTSTANYGTVLTVKWAGNNGTFHNNLIVIDDNHSNNANCRIDGQNWLIYNNFFFNIGSTKPDFYNTSNVGGANNKFYNNTGYGGGTMTNTGLNPGEIKNNIAQNMVTCYADKRGTYATNISSDATGDIINTTLTLVNTTTGDLHLVSGDTAAMNVGTDLSVSFTDDIDGDIRPTGVNTWDIGADEFVSGVVTIPSLIISDTAFIQNAFIQ